jgi:predicted  nucleic acid-binding Zn-ribbon protein
MSKSLVSLVLACCLTATGAAAQEPSPEVACITALRQTAERLNRIEQRVAGAGRTCTDAAQELARLRDQAAKLSTDLKEREAEVDRLRTQNRELGTQRDQARGELSKAAADLKAREAELESARATNKQLEDQLRQTREELSKATADLKQARDDLAKGSVDLNARGGELESAQATNKQLEDQIRQTREELAKATADLKQARDDLTKASTDLKARETELAAAQATSRQLEEQLRQARAEVTRVSADLQERDAQVGRLQTAVRELTQARTDLTAARARNTELTQQNGTLRTNADRLAQQNAEQARQLETLQRRFGDIMGQINTAAEARVREALGNRATCEELDVKASDGVVRLSGKLLNPEDALQRASDAVRPIVGASVRRDNLTRIGVCGQSLGDGFVVETTASGLRRVTSEEISNDMVARLLEGTDATCTTVGTKLDGLRNSDVELRPAFWVRQSGSQRLVGICWRSSDQWRYSESANNTFRALLVGR